MAKAQKTASAGGKAPSKGVRHARIELSASDYDRVKGVAKANGLAVAAYIRQAVLQRVRKDESGE